MDEYLAKLLKNKMKPVFFKELKPSILKAARKNTIPFANRASAFEASNSIARRIEYAAGNVIIAGYDAIEKLPIITEGIEKSRDLHFKTLSHVYKWTRFNVLLDITAEYDGYIVTYTDDFTEGFVNPAKRDFYAYIEGAPNA